MTTTQESGAPGGSPWLRRGASARRPTTTKLLWGKTGKRLLLQGEKAVAFSHLCGRKDLIGLVQELKQEGFITILGGPQARQDYDGEPEVESHPHRFRGLKSIVDIGLPGPGRWP